MCPASHSCLRVLPLLASCALIGLSAEPAQADLTAEGEAAASKLDAYVAFLAKDPERFTHELETIHRLRASEVEYRVALAEMRTRHVEGSMTTDGARIILTISNRGGCGGEVASINSRFAHELEHARQFEDGELAFSRRAPSDPWAAHAATYDIGDEVKAWTAQLRLALPGDFWIERDGARQPSLLRLFAAGGSDEARRDLLARRCYQRLNRTPNCDLVLVEGEGLEPGRVEPGRVVRVRGEWELYGRVVRVIRDEGGR